MSLIFLDAYEPTALTAFINYFNSNMPLLKLYQNNYTPVDTSVVGNFTEATFSGYAAVGISMIVLGEVAQKALAIDSVTRQFTHSSGGVSNIIYGYYVLDSVTGVVAWAEKFPAPVSMASLGDQISIECQLTLDSFAH